MSMRGPKNLPKKEQQARLLVVAHEVHTASGKHEVQIESWEAWAKRERVKPVKSAEEARAMLEQATETLGASTKLLPWNRY
jgi:hypothetical protein